MLKTTDFDIFGISTEERERQVFAALENVGLESLLDEFDSITATEIANETEIGMESGFEINRGIFSSAVRSIGAVLQIPKAVDSYMKDFESVNPEKVSDKEVKVKVSVPNAEYLIKLSAQMKAPDMAELKPVMDALRQDSKQVGTYVTLAALGIGFPALVLYLAACTMGLRKYMYTEQEKMVGGNIDEYLNKVNSAVLKMTGAVLGGTPSDIRDANNKMRSVLSKLDAISKAKESVTLTVEDKKEVLNKIKSSNFAQNLQASLIGKSKDMKSNSTAMNFLMKNSMTATKNVEQETKISEVMLGIKLVSEFIKSYQGAVMAFHSDIKKY